MTSKERSQVRDEIERLADETGRTTLMPVCIQRTEDMVVIDALNVPG